MDRHYRTRLTDFVRSVSWAEKTPYFYPPWKYLDALEGQRLETLDGFGDALSVDRGKPNDLNLYLHFPLCAGKCKYCSYRSGRDVLDWPERPDGCKWPNRHAERMNEYEDLLLAELGTWLGLIRSCRGTSASLRNIYIGGGTPSLWFDKERIARFFGKSVEEKLSAGVSTGTFSNASAHRRAAGLTAGAFILKDRLDRELHELSFELHPRDWGRTEARQVLDWLHDWLKDRLRVSIGVQSCSLAGLKQIGRLSDNVEYQEYLQYTAESIAWALERRITVNLDFMWGLKSPAIDEELDEIERRLGAYCREVSQYTFYRIWSPDDLVREDGYRRAVTDGIGFDATGATVDVLADQRKLIGTKMEEWGYEQDIYVEYFRKRGQSTLNGYNRGEMRDDDYLACGLGVHGKLGRILYVNHEELQDYAASLSRVHQAGGECEIWQGPYLPVGRFHIVPKPAGSGSVDANPRDEYHRRKAMLRLRLPGESFSGDAVEALLPNPGGVASFWEGGEGGGLVLRPEEAASAIPLMLAEVVENDIANNSSWQAREIHARCRQVSRWLAAGELDIGRLQEVVDALTFHLFKLANYATRCRVRVCNAAYYSSVLKTAVQGRQPWGLLSTEYKAWEKCLKERDAVDRQAKLSLFELFFKGVDDFGVPYPFRISQSQHRSWGPPGIRERSFLEFVASRTRSVALLNKVNEVQCDMVGVKEFLDLVDFFLRPGRDNRKFLYFVGSKIHPVGRGCGGVIISCSDELGEDDIVCLGDVIMPVFATISELEHNAAAARHALRSAVTALMARDLSHNIGSHGISHLLSGELHPADKSRKSLEDFDAERSSFLGYVKDRMDYIAEIATYWRILPWSGRPT